jgi:ATP-dependent DNA ligase
LSSDTVSRYGTVYTEKELPLLSEEFHLPPSTIIRGEMYYPGGRVSDLIRAISHDSENIRYAAHDMVMVDGKDIRSWVLTERKCALQGLGFIDPNSRLEIVQSLGIASTVEEIGVLFDAAIERKYEGVVIKPWDSVYRDYAWLKKKKSVTYDVLLTAVEKEHFRDGVPWTWRMEAFIGGKRVHVGEVSSMVEAAGDRTQIIRPFVNEDKQYLWFNEPIVAEIRAQEFYDKSLRFRHPVLLRTRNDKPVTECVLFGLKT